MGSAFANINWLSVIVASISSFLVGGIWYGPLFGKAWMVAFGFTETFLRKRSMSKVFGLSLLLAFVAALNLELFIGVDANMSYGLVAGFLAGFGWVATLLGILYLFENRSFKGFLINAGYCIVALTLMGGILGAW
ncbi:DUF1761 domain-containing protein [Cyclobacterium sp. 1_MG-2023]|uniref:DUF1761 domain-containing protein n=1 Tax=Cyclobacterium sp. 1_MG-2023 TaxID=3062681 RepID=UPI0026E3AAD0|nr:DUF1761 domain-containing protein [Cyclobacterium sp. 1_MG-2023]MDO6439417.1 DUF1761 domain-containing protein [Cyclobacterium sp. 1_MG-2023]